MELSQTEKTSHAAPKPGPASPTAASFLHNLNPFNSVLSTAASKGNTDRIDFLLTFFLARVDGRPKSDSPLFRAALKHDLETMKLLIDRGADPNRGSRAARRSHGCVKTPSSSRGPFSTPLHAAAGFSRNRWNSRHTHWSDEALARARECCQLLLDSGAEVNHEGYMEYTPLHFSVQSNLFSVTELLLENGADPRASSRYHDTPIHLIWASEHSIPTVKLLAKHGVTMDLARDSDGSTPIHLLSTDREFDPLVFAPFVRDWNVVDDKGNTPLHLMVERGAKETTALANLLRLGANIHQRNSQGQEPLHLCQGLRNSSETFIRHLIDAGADMEAKDNEGRTLLLLLLQRNASVLDDDIFKDIEKFVLAFSPDLGTLDGQGNGVLHQACDWHNVTAATQGLIKLGASPLIVNKAGETAMHTLMSGRLAKKGRLPVDVIRSLLNAGLSSTHLDHHGNTPLHTLCQTPLSRDLYEWPDLRALDFLLSQDDHKACHMENRDGLQPLQLAVATSKILVSKLVSKGVSTVARTRDGKNLLHIAASARQGNIVGFLIEHYRTCGNLELVLDQADNHGSTSLHVACHAGSLSSVRLLVDAGAQLDIRDDSGLTPREVCSQLIDEVAEGCAQKGPGQSYLPFQDADIGGGPDNQDNDAGQMVEILCYLGSITDKPPILRGDYALNTNDLPRSSKRSRCTPVLVKGDYKVFQDYLASGGRIDFGYNKETDLLSNLADGGYPFLFQMIGDSLKNTRWPHGDKNRQPYLLTAVGSTEPNMPVLRLLVERYGADVNVKWHKASRNSRGALHILARGYSWWQKEAVEYLLGKGANPNIPDSDGRTALHLAVISSHKGAYMSKDIIRILLENGADPNIADSKGMTPQDERNDDPEVAALLARYGGKRRGPDRSHDLLLALRYLKVQDVEDILQSGQDVHTILGQKKLKKPPIMVTYDPYHNAGQMYPLERFTHSMRLGQLERAEAIINLLWKHGADPLRPCVDDPNTLVLHKILRRAHHFHICEVFLAYPGVDRELRDPAGNTVFLAACQHYPWNVENESRTTMRCTEMYNRGADITVRNQKGNNALHCILGAPQSSGPYPTETKQKTLSEFIAVCPGLVHQKNNAGHTPIQVTYKNRASWAWQILIDAGADPTVAGPEGNTILHSLAGIRSGLQTESFDLFRARGVDVNARNALGETLVFEFVAQFFPKDDPESQCRDAMDFLSKSGCDFHVRNSNGEGLLHAVGKRKSDKGCYCGQYDQATLSLFQILVEHGLDPVGRDNRRKTAVDIAKVNGNKHVVEWCNKR